MIFTGNLSQICFSRTQNNYQRLYTFNLEIIALDLQHFVIANLANKPISFERVMSENYTKARPSIFTC